MRCRHHPTCPGCPLLDLPYEQQLVQKQARLASALARYPHLPEAPVVRAATRTEAYRHRLKLPLAIRNGKARIGLYHPRTREVLDTPDCPVLAGPLRAGLDRLLPALAQHPEVHSLDLRVSGAAGELQAVIAADGGSLKGGRREAERMRAAVPGLVSLAVSTADPERKRVMGRRPTLAAGEPWLEEAIGDARYRLYPGAFFQVDPDNARQLQGLVREAAAGAETILDLYAGVGAYAIALAPGRRRVVAVEEVPQAAAAARAMAPANVEVITSKVEDLQGVEPFDLVILNPARRGSDLRTLGGLASVARRAVYVSCGPETLARDLDVLAAHGLRVRQLAAVDLFPQTPEVETVALLERGPALESWPTRGGRAAGPWRGRASGALGAPDEAIALVIGDPGPRGTLPGARWTRIGVVATHALIRIELQGPLELAMRALARRGHPTAGRDERTARFFAEKAGLLRPFEHVTAAGAARAPLHGDLVCALIQLGADRRVLEAVGVDAREAHQQAIGPNDND